MIPKISSIYLFCSAETYNKRYYSHPFTFSLNCIAWQFVKILLHCTFLYILLFNFFNPIIKYKGQFHNLNEYRKISTVAMIWNTEIYVVSVSIITSHLELSHIASSYCDVTIWIVEIQAFILWHHNNNCRYVDQHNVITQLHLTNHFRLFVL